MSSNPGRAKPAQNADYALLKQQAASLIEDETDFIANAANFAALLYHGIPRINWAGFYFPSGDGLVLGPFNGRPACTRLPRGRGVCGAAFISGETVVVDDVDRFADHIVCDTASRSEIVIPLKSGSITVGVFDVDSAELARFTPEDQHGLEALVSAFAEHVAFPEALMRPDHSSSEEQFADIELCRHQHAELRTILDAIATAPVPPRDILVRLRQKLNAHSELEDGRVYPLLRACANEVVRHKAERGVRELGGLREELDALIDSWGIDAIPSSDTIAWQREWGAFQRAMEARMIFEDHDLFCAAQADLRR
ncbi:MAG: GAF domain-containing protein [Vulcanimicrobiaceae bacterium]